MSVIHGISRTLGTAAFTTVFTAVLRLSMPALAVLAATSTTGCAHTGKPSIVASGKEYTPGNAEYDEFFRELYQLQLALGEAPGKERAVRERLSSATRSAPDSNADQIATALEQRSAELAKTGVDIKVTTLGVEKGPSPSATLVTSGAAPSAKDGPLIAELGKSVKEAGALLSEVREAKPKLEKLQTRAPELRSGVDKTFGDKDRSQRADVRENLQDAEKLIPLMSTRADEVDRQVTELLTKIEKAAGATPAAAAPSARETPLSKKAKPGAKKKDRAVPAEAPQTTARPHQKASAAPTQPPAVEKPKPAAEAPKPPAEKPKPPADDFEP